MGPTERVAAWVRRTARLRAAAPPAARAIPEVSPDRAGSWRAIGAASFTSAHGRPLSMTSRSRSAARGGSPPRVGRGRGALGRGSPGPRAAPRPRAGHRPESGRAGRSRRPTPSGSAGPPRGPRPVAGSEPDSAAPVAHAGMARGRGQGDRARLDRVDLDLGTVPDDVERERPAGRVPKARPVPRAPRPRAPARAGKTSPRSARARRPRPTPLRQAGGAGIGPHPAGHPSMPCGSGGS